MGPDYHDNTGGRPRAVYKPREIDVPDVVLPFAGTQETASRNEALPEGWDIVWPNRIRERRECLRISSTAELAQLAGHISYQRLCKLERGIAVARMSELELLAAPLQCAPDDLTLPALSLSETVRWKSEWGSARVEGGDHNAVVLAAFVRKLVEDVGLTRDNIARQAREQGITSTSNPFKGIWHAEKPVDRWPDNTMRLIMYLAAAGTWSQVLCRAAEAYAAGALAEQVASVRRPRVRYAPEDPDRRAPWTYAIDPFRHRRSRRIHISGFSTGLPMSATERQKIEKRQAKQELIDETTRICRRIIDWTTSSSDLETRLRRLIPADKDGVSSLIRELDDATLTISAARARVIHLSHKTRIHAPTAAALLGITDARFYQLRRADRTTVDCTGFSKTRGRQAN